jgi:hypothetical protein
LNGKKKTGRKRFPQRSKADGDGKGRTSALSVRRHGDSDAWELVHPRCALERNDDLDEVQQMLEAGEIDVAVDELRWLLNGCSDLLRAHRMLGEIALEDGDFALARGHFGYAYDIGRGALPKGFSGTLPYRLPENQALHESAKGLAWSLHELAMPQVALDVVRSMLAWDPTDPLKVRPWLTDWAGGR